MGVRRPGVGDLLSITLLNRDPSEDVRAAAATALGKFALLSQTGKLLQKDGARIKQHLMRALLDGDESLSVRRRAMEAVAPFNTDDIQRVIQDAYKSSVKGMRYSAVYAMGKSCDPRWLPTILAELQNSDAAMRYEASNACGELGEEPAVPHLIALFEDDDHQTQISAITAVGNIGGSLCAEGPATLYQVRRRRGSRGGSGGAGQSGRRRAHLHQGRLSAPPRTLKRHPAPPPGGARRHPAPWW